MQRSSMYPPIYLTLLTLSLLPDCYWTCLPMWFSNYQQVPQSDKKFLLLLLDGFRWDYLNKPYLLGFQEVQRIGSRAEYSEPVFPSLSYPNYYTIVTGLYTESHGITLNYMYKQKLREKLDHNPEWWKQAEPLWITTTKAGLPTDLYLWPGCQVIINDTKPNHCLPYHMRITTFGLEGDLDQVVKKFYRDETKIALVYSEQPDLFGHIFGPDSYLLDIILMKLDSVILDLVKKLRLYGLENKVNVIIASDHGMTPVNRRPGDTLSMKDYINLNDVEKILDRGAAVGIFPKKERLDAVVESLKLMPNSRVWKKEDIPEHFHFKNNKNTPPVLLLADPGYFIQAVDDPDISILSYGNIPPSIADKSIRGFHGYDTNASYDMRGIFLAFGPGFRGPPIGNQDVYNLAMSIIGLPPKPNNGSWSAVSMYLINSKTKGLRNNVKVTPT